MVRVARALENELLENQRHPSLRGLRVQCFGKLNTQVATKNKHQLQFGGHIRHGLITGGLLPRHLPDHPEECAEVR